MNVSVGVIAEAEVHAGVFALGEAQPFTLTQTGLSLPTACLSYDAQAKTYGPASAVVASATASAGGKALPGGAKDPKGAATSGRSNPLGGVVGTWGRVQATAGILAAVFTCFLSL